jgi:hypothetical protein
MVPVPSPSSCVLSLTLFTMWSAKTSDKIHWAWAKEPILRTLYGAINIPPMHNSLTYRDTATAVFKFIKQAREIYW